MRRRLFDDWVVGRLIDPVKVLWHSKRGEEAHVGGLYACTAFGHGTFADLLFKRFNYHIYTY